MYPVSPLYQQFLERRDREWQAKVIVGGTEYGMDVIVDFIVENDLGLDGDFDIGTAVLSKLTLTLHTRDVIVPNAKVEPYLALFADDTLTEWLPMGEFYVDSRTQVNNLWVFTCYDRLVFADVPYISGLSYPATMQAVWDEICTDLAYSYDSTVDIDLSYTIPVGPAGFSKRDVLSYIAGAHGASVYIGKDGTVRWRQFAAVTTPAMTLPPSEYFRLERLGPIKAISRIVAAFEDDEEGTAYEAGTGDERHTLYINNPFATQQIVDDLHTRLNGLAYVPVNMDARAYPNMEAGDTLAFQADESIAWMDADIAWEDMELQWDGYTGYQTIAFNQIFKFAGGLFMQVEAPAKSEQASEFVVQGRISQQINRLNKTALKQGRDYFGVSITREDGLIVERGDQGSRVIFNSDALKWQVDSGSGLQDALYYDAVGGKLKYRGDIEMEGGSISWTAVNPPSAADVGALPDDTTVTDIGGVANTDGRLSQLSAMGAYLGDLAQGQVSGLVSKLSNINSIGDYIGALSTGQITGLSNRLTNITPTGVYTGTVGTDQLIAGSALIGTALIENLVVGSNVTMGPSASISWGQVTGKPAIPVLPGYIQSTYIDATTILSPTISAGTFTGGTIAIGTGNNIFKADTNGIYLGNATFGSAPFRVTPAGVLSATGANISGNITMTGGSINWSTVNTDPVASGAASTASGAASTASSALSAAAAIANGTYSGGTFINGSLIFSPSINGGTIAIGSGNSIFKADTNGIYLGNATFGSAPFRVTPGGAVTASNINITGGNINVGSDVSIGQRLYLNGSSFTAGITFKSGIEVYHDPSTNSLFLTAPGGVLANSRRIDTAPIAVFG